MKKGPQLALATVLACTAVALCPLPTWAQEEAEPVASAEEVKLPDEASAFKEAAKPFKDGLFDVTEARLGQFLEMYPESKLKPQALLLRGRCAYYLGQFDKAVEWLSLALADLPSPTPTKPEDGPQSAEELALLREALYWSGESYLAQAAWKPAATAFEAFDATFELAPPGGMVERVFGTLSNALSSINPLSKVPLETRENGQLRLANALLFSGDKGRAEALLSKLGQDESSPEGQQAKLLRARYALAQGDAETARNELQALSATNPAPPVRYQTAYLLGELNARDNLHDQALLQLERVTRSETAYPRSLVAEAWFASGQVLAKKGELEKAQGAFEQAYTRSHSQALKLAAFRRYLDMARKQQRLPEAIDQLRAFVRQNEEQPNAAAALFAIAHALAENGDTAQASGMLEAMLTAYPNTAWTRSAQFLLGKLHQQKGDYPSARAALLASRSESGGDLLSRQADFHLGELAYARRNYTDAAAAFLRASRGNDPLAEDALMNLLLSYSQLDNLAKFREQKKVLAQQFSASPYLVRVPLLEGTILERQGKLDEAEQVYATALAAKPTSEAGKNLRAELLIRQAELLEATGKSTEATKLYEEFAEQLPDSPEVVDAKRRAILAARASGRMTPDQAAERLLALLKAHPKDPQAPRIAMHLGEHFHAAGDYVSAQNQFQQIVADYPEHPLADDASFSAGLAAAAHGEYTDAVAILEKVRAESPLKTDARMLQGKIYHRQLRFQDALTIFDSLLQSVDDGPLYAEALLRRGHCLFAMAQNDPAQYELAASIYGQLIDSGQADAAQRNEAGFRRAKAFEKLGRAGEALALYLEVAQNGLTSESMTADAETPTVEEDEAAVSETPELTDIPEIAGETEILWRTKAGLEAGRLLQAREDWRGALRVYRQLEALGGPGASQLKALINRIRREQYLFE